MQIKWKFHHILLSSLISYLILFTQLEMETFKKGQCVCHMVVGQEDTNKYGTLHGGQIATLVDIVTTLAIMGATGKPGVSVEMGVR